jgi:hypothetical protein
MHATTMLPVTLAVLALGASAVAQEPAAARQVASARDLGASPAELPAESKDTTTPGAAATPPPYWSEGDARPFVSANIEASLLAARASIATGYGRPHYRWLGLEVRSRVSNKGGTEYAGLHVVTPAISVRAGGRYAFGLSQEFLLPDDSYTRQELDDETEGQQHYFGVDAELAATAQLLGAKLTATLTGMMITGVPSDRYVFEDELMVVVEPPWVWRGRLAALVPVDAQQRLEVGAAGEVLGVPERQMYVGRAGPVLGVAITRHLDARATVLLVVASRDRIGLDGADFAQLGLRYRWASGEPRPAFP